MLQVVLTLAAFGYLLHITNLSEVGRKLSAAPLWSIPVATGVLLTVVFAGTLRWSLLMRAYGANDVPGLGYLFRLQLIGLFYNMMPGAVGGDVLRGVVSRRAFGAQGMSAALTVVLVERVFGLIGLVLLVSTMLIIDPIQGLFAYVPPWLFGAGAVVSCGCIVAVALARRLGQYAPAALAKWLTTLPEISRPAAFVAAMLMSIFNQALVGVMGHLTIAPFGPNVRLADSLVVAPLAFAAVFVPVTVAGAGTRDGLMVLFYGLLGVPKESALAASFEILLAYALVAAIGGALSLMTPLRDPQAEAA